MSCWTAFALGLFGSLHCAGMCGPLALALPFAGRATRGLVISRLGYNLGRIITYCLIGALFGLLGKTFVLAGIQRWVSIALGLLLLAGLAASQRLTSWLPLTQAVRQVKMKMAPLLNRSSWQSSVALGVCNGFLPCGLVYVAAGASILSGNILAGMQYMLFFGLGTVPMLFAIGCSRTLFPPVWRLRLLKAVPASVFVLAALLILRGLALGIPYLSPDLASGGCCHVK
jgi:uncharacterized protein